MRSLNPWHFDSRFPAAECVFEFDNKLSGERNSSVDTVVSPSLEFALVDTKGYIIKEEDLLKYGSSYEIILNNFEQLKNIL